MAEQTPETSKKNPPVVPIIIAVVAIGAIGFYFRNRFFESTYEKRAEQMFEEQTGGKADINLEDGTSSFEFETEEGKVVINQDGTLPDDFPSDIDIYSGATVTGYVSMSAEDIQGFNATLSTNDSAEEVYNSYQESLVSNGWAILTKFSSEAYSSVAAEKDNRTIVVTITEDTTETIVLLTVKTE
jgi:hypothetical protein